MTARASARLVLVGISLIAGGCASTDSQSTASSNSSPGGSVLSLPSFMGSSGQDTSARATPSVAPSISGLKLSNVTARGLQAVGVSDIPGLVAWFNSIPGESDPFLAPMLEEIDGASVSAESIASLKLSGATVEALAAQNITVPADLPKLDRKMLKDSRKAYDLCRNEICIVMQSKGWTVLRAEVTNRPRASQLYLNDTPIGPIAGSEQPVWRRFLINAPGSPTDQRVIATLTVDTPNSADGLPAARWYKDVEVERGGELRLSLNIAQAPLPSIGFQAATPLSPAAVYAGDSVTLTCEGCGSETVWFTFGSPGRLDASSYTTAPGGSSSSAGLPAWFRLRSMAEAAATPRDNVLEEPRMEPILLGKGNGFRWNPQVETPSARIGVLTRGDNGFWGFAERTIAVADLRPGIWMMPNLPIDPDSRGVLEAAESGLGTSPGNIYLTYSVLSNLVYLADVGRPFVVDLRMDEFRDASVPLSSVVVDFGDGSAPVTVSASEAADAQIEHAFARAGDYRVAVRSKDAMGFERSHATSIRASAEAPRTASVTALAPKANPVVRRRIEVVNAESSFDLFRRAAEQFAQQVANQTGKAWNGRKIALAHIHDRGSRDLLDLMDSVLVNALMAKGASVFEREPMYQHMIGARGFVDASAVALVDQGAAPAAPDVDLVLDYKLKRAEVSVVPAGSLVVRTARIFAWVRVHERQTMRILYDGDASISIGGTIAAAESKGCGDPWNSYPEGFMIRSATSDRAVESIQEVPAESEKPPMVPAVPGVPGIKQEGAGGMLKGLFGG